MMCKLPQISTLCLLLLLNGCKKDTPAPVLDAPPPVASNRINFADPQVGQKSYYRRFEGRGIDSFPMPNITYFDDTLVVELLQDTSGTGLMLKEYYTAGTKPGLRIIYQDSAKFTSVLFTDDSVIVKAIPNYEPICQSILMQHRAQVLDLKPYTSQQVDIVGWTSIGWTGNQVAYGYAKKDTINANAYPHLNIVRKQSLGTDPTTTFIFYEKQEGVVRTNFRSMSAIGQGFDLIK